LSSVAVVLRLRSIIVVSIEIDYNLQSSSIDALRKCDLGHRLVVGADGEGVE
ncbi:hypothetical protein U1Q18_019222, partial [Sarracenia purpurea var. burkii]